jgi:hypothetical protein
MCASLLAYGLKLPLLGGDGELAAELGGWTFLVWTVNPGA